jgi:hypothetical protein
MGTGAVSYPGILKAVMRDSLTVFMFCFCTVTLPVLYWRSFCETQTRRSWERRNKSVLFKRFRSDISEAAYVRFRFASRFNAVVLTLVWLSQGLRLAVVLF